MELLNPFCKYDHARANGENVEAVGGTTAATATDARTNDETDGDTYGIANREHGVAECRYCNNNNSNHGVGEQRYKPKRFNRPVIDRDIDDREWALLMDTWGRYKDMCRFAAGDTTSIRSMRATCSDDVNKLLFEFVGASVLNECTEEQLLGHIKAVAVKHTHKEVHRMWFDQLVQGDGESVIQYVARLKSKAFLCPLDIECFACHSQERQSYAEDMIVTRLTSGLRNQEHKRKVLAEAETFTTLDAKVRHYC